MHADGALLDVDLVVDVAFHQGRQPGELGVPVRPAVGRTGDDQRRTRLVDEDRVDLVDDREGVAPPLHAVLEAMRHVVAQVVEAELVVGAVGDVGVVGGAPLVGGHLRQDHPPDVHAEEAVHAAHLLGVAFGQVVVDGDDVHALALERVEVGGGEHGGQGLALTGLHLGDVAEVQRRAAHHLNVEVALVEHSPGRLAGDGERLGHQVVEILAAGEAVLELVGLAAKFGVGQLLDVVGQGVDVVSHPLEALDHAAFAETEQLRQHAVLPFFLVAMMTIRHALDGHHRRRRTEIAGRACQARRAWRESGAKKSDTDGRFARRIQRGGQASLMRP